MNTRHMHYLLSIAVSILFLTPAKAQFTNGITLTPGQEKVELSGRTWHISSKINNDEPLLGAGGTDLALVGSNVTLTSHFIIEPAADDGKWWTSDARWFYIRSVNSGLYITINSTNPNVPVEMAPLYTGNDAHKQQFRAVLSATPDWYKLRSRLSDSGNGIVLEVGNNNDIYPAAPRPDPSSDQKFAFNLAMPELPQSKYAIVGINNFDYISDNGIHGDGTVAVHVKGADRSTIWHLIASDQGYFELFNPLTQQYLSVANNSGLGDEIIMTTSAAGDRSKWELIRERHTFKIKNKATERFIGTFAQTETGRPLREVGPLGIGIRWSIFRIMEPEAEVIPGNYQRIAEAPNRSDCLFQFGDNFKRALAERVGLPADPAYFPIILAAVADSVPPGMAEETLAKFDLNNSGHRVNLALLVRQYILKNVALRPRNTWSPEEEMVVAWLEQRILNLRVNYAQRLTDEWNAYQSGAGGTSTWGMNVLLENVDVDGFEWPTQYIFNGLQDSFIAEYSSAAKTFKVKNPARDLINAFTSASVSVGAAIALNNIVFYSATAYKSSAALTNISIVIGETSGKTISLTTANTLIKITSAGSGPATVITMAISVLVAQAMDVAKVQELLNDIDDIVNKMNAPVQIDLVIQGNNELKKTGIFDDLDYIMGAPAPNGFLYNTNDNLYGPAFTFTCRNAASVSIGANGTASVAGNLLLELEPLAFCGDAITYSASPDVFNCSQIGTYNVILTLGNNKGSSTCTVPVTVMDNTAPSLTCKNHTIMLNAAGVANLDIYNILQSNGDNCGTVHLQGLSQSTFSCEHLGTNTVTLTVDDTHGNTNTCQAVVTVADNIAPAVQCKSATIYLNAAGIATLPAAQVFGSGTDNCGTVSPVSVSKSAFFCNDIGAQNVVLTVDDGNGNTQTCTAIVTVNDNALPTITCPNNSTVSSTPGLCGAAVNYSVSGSDNCSGWSLLRTSGLQSGALFPVGTSTVTWKNSDTGGNSTTCAFTVTVTDGQLPGITCPANITANAAAGSCAATVNYTTPTFSDNCSGASAMHVSGGVSGSSFNKGATVVEWKATDAANNTRTCSFTITVNDNQLPSITCPANITANTATGSCAATVNFNNATATDNCTPPPTVIQSSGQASGSSFPKGLHTISFKATDGAGLTKTCTFRITVVDNVLPTITCPSNIVKNTDNNLCTAVTNYAVTGTDNCSSVSVSRASGLASGAAFPRGVNTVIWRATDLAGNSTLCSFTVTVSDAQLPGITCPTSISTNTTTGQCSKVVNYTTPTYSDNCAGGSISLFGGLASGSVFPVGTSTVTWRAIDNAANSNTCAFTVTVTDNELPVITCPPAATVSGSGSPCGYPASQLSTPAATDNCAVTSLASNAPTTLPAGANTITWTAGDAAGNQKTCAYVVTVNCGTAGMMNDEIRMMNDAERESASFLTVPSGQALITHNSSLITHHLSLFPNPASDFVVVTLSNQQINNKSNQQLIIHDAFGRELWREVLAPELEQLTVDLLAHHLEDGVYQVSWKTDNVLITKSLVVTKK